MFPLVTEGFSAYTLSKFWRIAAFPPLFRRTRDMKQGNTMAGRARPGVFRVVLLAVFLAGWGALAQAPNNIYEDGAGYIAFEATIGAVTNSPPTVFATLFDTNVAAYVLYTAGEDEPVPTSFVSYPLRFSTPGAYTLYYRWRADTNWTALNPNAANSFLIENNFDEFPANATFTTSASGLESAPLDTSYHVTAEPALWVATPADLDTDTGAILRIGIQKAGVLLDRFVFSTNSNLTEQEFNALADSRTDSTTPPCCCCGMVSSTPVGSDPIGFVSPPPGSDHASFQSFNADHVAFEAESAVLSNSGIESFLTVTDPAASGSGALGVFGPAYVTNTASFATYQLYFGSPGVYRLYYRWKTDTNWPGFTTNYPAGFLVPSGFGNLTNVSDFLPSVTSRQPAPTDGVYHYAAEPLAYAVTTNMAGSGVPATFNIGTGTIGLWIDRIILSQETNLSAAAFDALPDSSPYLIVPLSTAVIGSAGLTNLTVSFNQPLLAGSVIATNITVDGGLTVLGAWLDTNTLQDLHVWTTAQTEGQLYNVAVTAVADWLGLAGSGGGAFTAWVHEPGWVTLEYYFGLGAGTMAAATNNLKFPGYPDQVNFNWGFQMDDLPPSTNYALRAGAWFNPPTNGVYEFYLSSDDEAQLWLGTNDSEASLELLATASCCQTNSTTPVLGVSPRPLTAGSRYLLRGIFVHPSGPGHFQVVARLHGSGIAPSSLPVLGGGEILTYVNPDLRPVALQTALAGQTVNAGGSATFSSLAVAPFGAVTYQWQLNGTNLAGATRPAYTTPSLSPADSGGVYTVVITAGGSVMTSAPVTLTVAPAPPGNLIPYIGVKFSGGYQAPAGSALAETMLSLDAAGVAPQQNFNNLPASPLTSPLLDENGSGSPVVFSDDATACWASGTGVDSSRNAFLASYIFKPDYSDLHFTLTGVPPGNYDLFLYALGAHFPGSQYHEAVTVAGSTTPPTLHVLAQDLADYQLAPGYVRAGGTNAAAPQKGNYFEFDGLHPGANGSIAITISSEPAFLGNGYPPILNGLQLVSVVGSNQPPALVQVWSGLGVAPQLLLYWGNDAAGWRLETTTNLAAGSAGWAPAPNVPNPLLSAGSFTNTLPVSAQFFRLKQ